MEYEIIDNKGVIHSGSYDEMILAFYAMTKGSIFLFENGYAKTKKQATEIVKKYYTSWTGDIKLVQILKRDR